MRFAGLIFALLVISFCPGATQAQENNHADEIAAQANAIFNDPGTPAFGNPQGNLTIVEYFDYQCGYCKASEEGIEKTLQENPDLKIIYKDFPKLGPLSVTAAHATLAALRQDADKYWKFHSWLMSKDTRLAGEPMLYEMAASLGLDVDRLKQDMNDPAIDQQIENNIAVGKSVGVTVTPSFIVGGHLYSGAAPYDRLKQIIDYERVAKR